jgi:hypothetical protein
LTPAERRRSPRIRLQIPLFVKGVDASGTTFLDLTKTFNIGASGAFMAIPRALGLDALIQLTIPAPPPTLDVFSNVPPETPPILARVKRQQIVGEAKFVGVEFLKPLDG